MCCGRSTPRAAAVHCMVRDSHHCCNCGSQVLCTAWTVRCQVLTTSAIDECHQHVLSASGSGPSSLYQIMVSPTFNALQAGGPLASQHTSMCANLRASRCASRPQRRPPSRPPSPRPHPRNSPPHSPPRSPWHRRHQRPPRPTSASPSCTSMMVRAPLLKSCLFAHDASTPPEGVSGA